MTAQADYMQVGVKGQLELCVFESRGHAVEHVLVISLQVPELVYLVVTHQLRHTGTGNGLPIRRSLRVASP